MNNDCLELLSPAGNFEDAEAAVSAGADAVYIGGPAFGARAQAGNSVEDIERVCTLCHRFGASVYVTLNNLVADHELKALRLLIRDLGNAGADAFIIRDPVFFTLGIPPGVALHASTQCALTDSAMLPFLAALGVRQTVLPRELSAAEIAAWHKACPQMRLEAFVSGALCAGESGRCRISEAFTGRSADRGECAQICRLRAVLRRGAKELASGHLLSLKDNDARGCLGALIAAGVRSFKIEGRLKGPEYVRNQTAQWHKLLTSEIGRSGGRLRRASGGQVRLNFTPDIRRTFCRDLTDGYLTGRREKMATEFYPGSEGMPAGTVRAVSRRGKVCRVSLDTVPGVTLSAGDGFTARLGGELAGFRAERAEGRVLEVRDCPDLQAGTVIRRNHDIAFIRTLRRSDAAVRELRVDALLTGDSGRLVLELEDELGRRGRAETGTDVRAEHLAPHKALEVLQKRGAPFCARAEVQLTCPVPLSAGRLNALRQEAYSRLFAGFGRPHPEDGYRAPETFPCWPEGVPAPEPEMIRSREAAEFLRSLGVPSGAAGEAAKTLTSAAALPESDPRDRGAEGSVGSGQVLMICRRCLIKEYDHCRRGREAEAQDGCSLEIAGRVLDLKCDPERCRMLVLARSVPGVRG